MGDQRMMMACIAFMMMATNHAYDDWVPVTYLYDAVQFKGAGPVFF